MYFVPNAGSVVARFDTTASFSTNGSWSTFDTASLGAGVGQFAGADRPDVSLVPGEYRVAAEFVGEAVTKTNQDVAGLALMTYWTGTVRTGELRITVPANPK